MNLRVIHRVSKARGVVHAASVVEGDWLLLVELDASSDRHTSMKAVSIGPGQLASWFREEVTVEGAP